MKVNWLKQSREGTAVHAFYRRWNAEIRAFLHVTHCPGCPYGAVMTGFERITMTFFMTLPHFRAVWAGVQITDLFLNEGKRWWAWGESNSRQTV